MAPYPSVGAGRRAMGAAGALLLAGAMLVGLMAAPAGAVVPTITAFSPISGPVGTTVTITGTYLTGATAVKFNGVAATTFTVDSDTQITAAVPTGATTGPIAVTTPGGTATSSTDFTVGAGTVPTITSFAPASGEVGTQVTITGTEFTGATAVTFGGVDTTSMTVDSATQITAFVPPFAVTGPIAVTAPGGTATSSTDFTVIALSHGRHVSLNLPGDRAKGNVTVTDEVNVCAARVPVKLQHLVNGSWHRVASLTTSTSGAFHVAGVTADGKYRAVATKVTLGGTDICKKATSPTVHQ